MAAKEQKQEHKWAGPDGMSEIKAFNSLTGTKTPLIPSKTGTRQLGWYICGPTVYDSAHMGHARAYVSFDIVRRILEDFFGFHVKYVMNVTDLDDKIIVRARRNHLLSQYQRDKLAHFGHQQVCEVIDDITRAFSLSIASLNAKCIDYLRVKSRRSVHEADKKQQVDEFKLSCLKLEYEHFGAVATSAVAATTAGKGEFKVTSVEQQAVILQQLIDAGKDVLGDMLDSTLGASVTDLGIFEAHARRYELEFLRDMRALGVRDASVVTRVSEYVPKIIDFVQDIVKKDMAYEALTNNKDEKGNKECSVLFDTDAFRKSHTYAKLSPHSVCRSGHTSQSPAFSDAPPAAAIASLQEAEGALSVMSEGEKKNKMDFALWKRSKRGEPRWPSPWGNGRPGWHIECSTMAMDIFGDCLDIHAGGEDLKFPHHDNELAQSEARSGKQQWVNHFWHAGHLHIDGLKMSKSLKNFVTIGDALKTHSGRQLRLLFLFQAWDHPMNYCQDLLKDAVGKERTLVEFVHNIKATLRACVATSEAASTSLLWNEHDLALDVQLADARTRIYDVLADNFQYHVAARILLDLIGRTNKYLASTTAAAAPKASLLTSISTFVAKTMNVFGVNLDIDSSIPCQGSSQDSTCKYLDAISAFRDKVRMRAQSTKDRDMLAICDELRDSVMPSLGVRLEDKAGGRPSVWKLDHAQVIAADKERKMLLSVSSMQEVKIAPRNDKGKQDKARKMTADKMNEARRQAEASEAIDRFQFAVATESAWISTFAHADTWVPRSLS